MKCGKRKLLSSHFQMRAHFAAGDVAKMRRARVESNFELSKVIFNLSKVTAESHLHIPRRIRKKWREFW